MRIKNVSLLAAFVATVSLAVAGQASAHPSLEQQWLGHLTGAELTNQYNVVDPVSGQVTSTIDNDYYFCADGTFAHGRRIIAGGEPPFTTFQSPFDAPLLPTGKWKVNIVDNGFGTQQAELQLSSSNGALRRFPLGYSNGSVYINGAKFFTDPGRAVSCGAPADPFGGESPLK